MPKGTPRQSPRMSSTHMSTDDLYNEFLKLAKELVSRDANLFKTAVAHISAMTPREPSPVRRAAGAEQKGIQSNGGRKNTTAFHKYSLPGDKSAQEFYQCMTCGERRPTNSFHGDHQEHHKGEKFQVRWFCPMCNTYFAVTHRGYHIKNRHKSQADEHGHKRRSSGTRYDDDDDDDEVVDSDGDNEEYACKTPKSKKGHFTDEDDGTSQGSPTETLIKIKREQSVVLSDAVDPAPIPIQGQVPGALPVQSGSVYYDTAHPPPPQPAQLEPIMMQPEQFPRQPSMSLPLTRMPTSGDLTRLQTSGDFPGTNAMPPSNLDPMPSTGTFERTPTELALNGGFTAPQQESNSGIQQPELAATGVFTPSTTLANLASSGNLPAPQSGISGSGPLPSITGSDSMFASSSSNGTGTAKYLFPDNKAVMEKEKTDK